MRSRGEIRARGDELDIGEEKKREFVEPQLIKCEEPLDKVTIAIYGDQTDSNNCNWLERLFNLGGC